jgi:biopolymer transport protein ExbD
VERRVDFILMFGNISTLLGLMGTIYGLILSFAAVAQPGVAAVEKSSMLASGISTAMNTTLLGLIIAVPCMLVYAILRSKVAVCTQEIDRYAVAILKSLLPEDVVQRDYRVTAKRIKQEVDTKPNIAPMMNLMVILIPLLLTSAEFVKLGAIELQLPEAAPGGGGGGGDEEAAKLNVGIAISAKGFNLYHYFKKAEEPAEAAAAQEDTVPKVEIPLRGGEYDFGTLGKRLAEVKRKALLQIVRSAQPGMPDDAGLYELYRAYMRNEDQFAAVRTFADHEEIKVVAEDKIKYQVVVSVMDAARGMSTPSGNVTMFPNVSLAGGIAF